jgi:hypothetical protein
MRTFFMRVQRYHVPLQVLGTCEAFQAARHSAGVRSLARFVRLGHPTSAALLDEVGNRHGGYNALALWGAFGFSFLRGDHDYDRTVTDSGDRSFRLGVFVFERWLDFYCVDVLPRRSTCGGSGGRRGRYRCIVVVFLPLVEWLCVQGTPLAA